MATVKPIKTYLPESRHYGGSDSARPQRPGDSEGQGRRCDRYAEDKTNVAIVPLVTEDVLGSARRLLKVLSKLQTQAQGSSKFLENTIFSYLQV